MIEFGGSHFEREVILWGVGQCVAHPISFRRLEEMMEERGVEVDHATLNRWVVKYIPLLEANVRSIAHCAANMPRLRYLHRSPR
jgi:transposase-like protein